MRNRWPETPPSEQDPVDQIVHLSNLVGAEGTLVQPGGGNSSIKVRGRDGETRLFVKGSGTDLETIGRAGFTQLSMTALSGLSERVDMSDEQMMEFMRSCMLRPGDPLPSVETPLHSLLPARVIVHTHDIATMSLTNLSEERSQALLEEIFEGNIFYVPYARPGFPLARVVQQLAPTIPGRAQGLALAHHGLVVWGDDPETCYTRLCRVVDQSERYFEASQRGARGFGALRTPPLPSDSRLARAEQLLPVVRGALSEHDRVVLHFDDDPELLDTIGREQTRSVSERGVATPEHVLRAGRRPIWIELGDSSGEAGWEQAARAQLAAAREEYQRYHERNAAADEAPLVDWAKVVAMPGVGLITAFRDKKSARTANLCFRATLAAQENAESLGGFAFLPEEQVFEFERWPLERRKVENAVEAERKSLLLPRHIAIVIGGGSGIGEAAAHQLAEAGASVVVSDLSGDAAEKVAKEISRIFPDRAIARRVDVRDDSSLDALFRDCVLEYGGLDTLFYSAGLAPHFAAADAVTREQLLSQLDVHYLGALQALGRAARVMRRQGRGGSIIANVSKAALAPGRDAIAYGGSKAALQHALRVAALELGEHGIRVNSINADQIDTPLFRRFVEERARQRGRSFEEQIEDYRSRNALGVSLIPARAVGELVVLLASERFRFTTGDILTVDGGLGDAFPR